MAHIRFPKKRLHRETPKSWHCRQRKIIFKLLMHCTADTDTDTKLFWNQLFVADADIAVLGSLKGGCVAGKKDFGRSFHFITDTDTDK